MTGHESWEQQAAGYALDALEPDEAEEFVAHLASCAECRALVDRHSLVAAQLGALAYDERPAPTWGHLRGAIVDTTDELPSNVVHLRPRRAKLLTSAAAAAVALVVGVTVWHATGGSGHGPLTSASSCSRTAGCHVVALHAGTTTSASVLVYGNDVRLVSSTMPRAPEGSEWALWRLSSSKPPQLLTVFSRADGTRASLGASYADIAGFAVSREPVGTTPTKPSAVVATGLTA